VDVPLDDAAELLTSMAAGGRSEAGRVIIRP